MPPTIEAPARVPLLRDLPPSVLEKLAPFLSERSLRRGRDDLRERATIATAGTT